MESFKHVSNTWLIAQLIHPFIFYGLDMMVEQEWVDFSYVPLVIIFGFLFSLAGYVLSILSFRALCRIKVSITQKFFLWIIIMMVCIMTGVYLTCLIFFDSRMFFETILLVVPGMLAAVVSACIRLKQFVLTVNFLSEEVLTTNF